MSTDRSQLFDRLAEEFVSRRRNGSDPSISDYAGRHPELADDIRELFPMLVTMEDLKPGGGPPVLPTPTMLGDYRLVREIGRGGMGVVYEAVQQTLSRRVALKVLPMHATTDPRHRERFRIEAQAAGRLQHAHIVPVIGYGEHDGVHYYAMQYVEGRGLDVVVREVRRLVGGIGVEEPRDEIGEALARHLLAPDGDASSSSNTGRQTVTAPDDSSGPWSLGRRYQESVARLLLDAAEGVAAAHARGILHRDLKPSNLMLDEQGRVWITDFGLCKEEGTGDLTRPDDMLGTLRYMPPERLQGESDVQGDVYGLGITLYELVTATTAYAGEHGAALVKRIPEEAPRRPRLIERRIPSDLEAIVRKATARDRRERYATADALAADLRAFLEGRPIAARAPRLRHHLRSAIRRHKPLAVTLLLAGTVIVGSTIYYVESLGRQEAEARLQHYVANITAAEAALRLHDADTAARLLDSAPEEFRNWEWRHLRSRLDRSLRELDDGIEMPYGVSYSPDGAHVAVGGDMAVAILEYESGRRVARLESESDVTAVRWSPRGDCIAVGTSNGIEIRDWPARTLRHHLHNAGRVQALSFHLDGRRVAAGGRAGRLTVWDVDGGREISSIDVHTWIHALDFRSGDDRVAVGGGDGRATMWDVATGQRLWSTPASVYGLHGITFVGRDLVATPSESHHACVWSASDGSLVRIVSRLRQTAVAGVRASDDGRVLVTTSGFGSEVWDTATWTHVAAWPGRNAAHDIAIHPSGSRMAIATARGVSEWDLRRDPDVLRGHIDDVNALAFAPNGEYVVSGGIGGVIRKWDPATGEQVRAWIGHRLAITDLAVTPDSAMVVAGDYLGDVLVWDARTDDVVHRFEIHDGPVYGVTVSHDGRHMASVGADGWLRVWDLPSGRVHGAVLTGDEIVGCVQFSPDDAALVTGDASGRIRFWDPATLTLRRETQAHEKLIEDLAFSARRGVLASASLDGTVRLWDAQSLEPRHVAHLPPLMSVAFSPDGSRVAVGARDGTVRLLDTSNGRVVATLNHLEWVCDVAWSPDGEQLLSASSAGEVRIWDTRSVAERRLTRTDGGVAERGRRLAEELLGPEPDEDAVLRALEDLPDVEPEVREAAVRVVHRRRGSEASLVARLWRDVTPRDLDPLRRRISCGLALDMARAAGHRNRPDSRRNTLLGALTYRCGEYDKAVGRIRSAMMLNEERFPELFAVDLAFLAMSEAALEDEAASLAALDRLESQLSSHPEARTPRVEGFLAEAREAVSAAR